MGGLDEVVSEFLVESHDGLNQMDQDLIVLEKDPRAADILDGIFRAVHTIKGTAGLLGYAKLVAVSHVGENLLGRLRDGALTLTPEMATDLLAMGDALREMLRSVKESGNDGDGDYDALIGRFSGWVDAPPAAIPPAAIPQAPDSAITVDSQPPPQTAPPDEKRSRVEDVPPTAPTSQASSDEPEVAGKNGPDEQVVADARPTRSHVETESPVDGARAESTTASTKAEGSIRVNVEVLDKLMDLMGELVLARW